MKTIICKKPGKFVFTETAEPEPAKDEALIQVRNIGICGTDLHAYRGQQPFFEYPRILGHELSGEVIHPGSNPELQPGDQVVVNPYLSCGKCIACRHDRTNCCESLQVLGVHCDGGMRERITIPASNLIPAKGLGLDQMATVECLTIGAHAVRRSEIQAGEWAAVVGTGPIGIGVIQFAQAVGAHVIAVDVNEDRLDYCREVLGVDAIVNANSDPIYQLKELTGGDKPTTVYEVTGNKGSMEASFNFCSHGGQLVLVGLVKDSLSFDDPHFHKHELTLRSSRNGTEVDLRYVIKSIRAGKIDTENFITHRCGFNEMISQFDSWLQPETGVIKAMVELG